MSWLEAMILGLIQGLTEYLPVSSSGHLAIGSALFGIQGEENLAFTIVVHVATVCSTLVILWKEIDWIFKGLFKFQMNDETRYVINIVISMIPIELDGGKVNKDFVQQIVQTLGLDDRLDALPNQLSGGQQQRVAIARALAAAPAIILADEPTGNLDSKTSQDVLSLLKVTSQKFAQTIVMITHNEEIAQMADRIIRIEDGRIVSQN